MVPQLLQGIHISHRQLRGQKGSYTEALNKQQGLYHSIFILFVLGYMIKPLSLLPFVGMQRTMEGGSTNNTLLGYSQAHHRRVTSPAKVHLQKSRGAEGYNGRQEAKLRTPGKGHPAWLPPRAVPGQL